MSFSTRLKSHLLALVALIAVGVTPASSQDAGLQSYDVELVIFRQLNPTSTPEHWRIEGALAGERLSIPEEEPSPFGTTEAPIAAPTSFPALSSAKFQLTAIEEALRRSRDYRPIAHFGWTQPGYPRNDARFFPIVSMVPESTGLKGQIALSRGRFLHLTLDLVYEIPEAPGERYVLRQTRRMRSTERHYIDHPMFGVIAVITPSGSQR